MNSTGPSLLAKSLVALFSAAAMAAVPLLTVNYVAQAQAQAAPSAAVASAGCKEKGGKKAECCQEKKPAGPKDGRQQGCCSGGK